MQGRHAIHGHAIVSADDFIAGADGITPPSLRNDADWARFQAALDAAAVTVLGRLGHEANPNAKARNRLVVSSSGRGIERRADAWWWNPAGATLAEALAKAAPGGGVVAVTGGMRVFDLFLAIGYDEFHLARARKAHIGNGVPVFGACASGVRADNVLRRHGLVQRAEEVLDPVAGVTLAVWGSAQPL